VQKLNYDHLKTRLLQDRQILDWGATRKEAALDMPPNGIVLDDNGAEKRAGD
jgi:hypothetical protein